MQIQRKSYSEIGRTYFFTATIHQWLPLLSTKENKDLIINYLKELSGRGFIKVYSFVIMPNHVHFIWEQLQKNGKAQFIYGGIQFPFCNFIYGNK